MKGEDAIRDAVVNAEDVTAAEDAAPDGPGGAGGDSRDLALAKKLHNDSGNGERLRARFGRDMTCTPELGRFHWSGGRGAGHWNLRDGERHWQLAAQKTAAAMMWKEAAALEASGSDAKKVFELRQFAIESGNRARLNAMQSLSEPYLEKRVDQLDADPFLFNVQNGTLELLPKGPRGDEAGVRLRRAARTDLITRIAPVGYDPAAECVGFRRFLDRVVPDIEVQDWLQRWFGYGLSADYGEHKLAVFWGEGRNGKGVLTKLMQWLYGDYGATVQFQTFIDAGQRRGSEPSPDLAKLTGVRAVFASEAKKGARLDDGLIKQLTGGDPASVRKLNKDFFDLAPTFKLNLIANNRPTIRDDTVGMWSRVMLVPFTVTIPEGEIDRSLLNKLKREGPGILNWCRDGWLRWREVGLTAPQAILAATAEYRKESDLIGQFIEAACVRDPLGRIAASQLYACYQGWCEANELRPVKQAAFGRELTRRQILPSKDGVVMRAGVKWSGNCDWDWTAPM